MSKRDLNSKVNFFWLENWNKKLCKFKTFNFDGLYNPVKICLGKTQGKSKGKSAEHLIENYFDNA